MSRLYCVQYQRLIGDESGERERQLSTVNSLLQFVSPGPPSTVVVAIFYLNLSNWGKSSSTIFNLLRANVLIFQDDRPPDQYPVTLDDRVHPTESGFEGREPIGGLLRDVDEYLYVTETTWIEATPDGAASET